MEVSTGTTKSWYLFREWQAYSSHTQNENNDEKNHRKEMNVGSVVKHWPEALAKRQKLNHHNNIFFYLLVSKRMLFASSRSPKNR